MAAISITAADIIPSANAVIRSGTVKAGVTITAGQLVAIDTASSDQIALADADASAILSTVAGIATNGASAGQKCYYVTRDPALTLTTTTPILSGDTLWSHSTAGAITKTAADIASTWYPTVVGVMTSTTVCNFQITRGGLKA